jgi:hypothetical protein
MNEPFDVVVTDGSSDPFSAWSEARVHELVTGHRRHGLHTVTRPKAHQARNRADKGTAGNLTGYLRSTYVDPRRAAS